jgi:hypothetical protein
VSGDVCAALAACPNLARASVVATRCTGDVAALAGLTRLQVSPGEGEGERERETEKRRDEWRDLGEGKDGWMDVGREE